MASSTQSPAAADAAAKSKAAAKPAAAKTTQAKATPRTRTTRAAADKGTTANAGTATAGATAANAAADAAPKPGAKPKETKATTGPKASAAGSDTTSGAKSSPKADTKAGAKPGSGHVVTVTIPITVDQLVAATVTVVKLPTAVVRRVVSTKRGLPVYLGIGGLAVAGVAEWPVAAAAGVGYAALRRWGPLRPGSAPAEGTADKPKSGAAPEAEQVTIVDEGETAS
ncbi:MAG TPA: hypothetical protein VGX23_28695 [Actinocrinis sp.]|nr:hypothetical protein [Actinocrinis sp.]